jgi:hypothetical protein
LWSWEDIMIVRIIFIIENIAECIIIIRIVIIIKVDILVLALFTYIIIFILLALISRLRFLPSFLTSSRGVRLNIVINITNEQPHETANCASSWLIVLQGLHSELSFDLRMGV